jgi:hypothetical protein
MVEDVTVDLGDGVAGVFIKKGGRIWKYGKRDIIFAAVLTTSLIKKG